MARVESGAQPACAASGPTGAVIGSEHRDPMSDVALQPTADFMVRRRSLRSLAARDDGSAAAELWREVATGIDS